MRYVLTNNAVGVGAVCNNFETHMLIYFSPDEFSLRVFVTHSCDFRKLKKEKWKT